MALVRPTIKDVASAAGVTAGTVSRALRDDPRVIESTRLRIVEAARHLNYRPNLQARGLQTGKTGAVGLACPSGPWILVHPYFTPMHAGFTAAASADGVRVILYMPPRNGELALDAGDVEARELLDGRVDGSIIYQGHNLSHEILRELQDMGLAVVLMNTDEEIPGFFQIFSNTRQRISESLRWANEIGARRVGVLGLSVGCVFNKILRRSLESIDSAGVVTIHEISNSDPGDTTAVDVALDALVSEKPDALIFNSDPHAARFLQRQLDGSLPGGIKLFSQGVIFRVPQILLPGVHYVEADLLAAGRNAYHLFKDAQAGKPPRTESLIWTRRP